MFETVLDVVLDALVPRLLLKERWRASEASLSKLLESPGSKTSPLLESRDSVTKPVPIAREGDVNAPPTRRAAGPIGPALDRESRVLRLRELEQKVSGCAVCPELVRSRTQPLAGAGNVEASILFVEEAPSQEQDSLGLAGVGEASELLDKMLKAMGLSRGEVFVVHFLRCRPPQAPGDLKARKATAEELNACRSHMEELVRIVQPHAIVAFGAAAARGLCGTQEPVARLRSRWHEFMGIPVMPTFHPSYLIENKDTASKRKVWEDLMLVMEKVNMPISPRQRAFFLR